MNVRGVREGEGEIKRKQRAAELCKRKTRERKKKKHTPRVRLEQLRERLGVELVVAEVQARVDRLERLEVDVELLLLAVVGHHGPRVEHEPVGRHLRVELEPLLRRRDRSQDRLPVDAVLDVGGGAELVAEHLGHAGDLVARGHDERDHRGAVAAGLLEALDELFFFFCLFVCVCRGREVSKRTRKEREREPPSPRSLLPFLDHHHRNTSERESAPS